MDTKELIAKARSAGADGDAIYCWNVCNELADALERLTQPVGVEPFRWIRILTNGAEIVYQRPISEAEAKHISEMGDEFLPVHSAETVARLITERDEWMRGKSHWMGIAEKHAAGLCEQAKKIDALQEQVKMLRKSILAFRNEPVLAQRLNIRRTAGYIQMEDALDATETKGGETP